MKMNDSPIKRIFYQDLFIFFDKMIYLCKYNRFDKIGIIWILRFDWMHTLTFTSIPIFNRNVSFIKGRIQNHTILNSNKQNQIFFSDLISQISNFIWDNEQNLFLELKHIDWQFIYLKMILWMFWIEFLFKTMFPRQWSHR